MKYAITVNGKQFEVEIERLSARESPSFAPAPGMSGKETAIPHPPAAAAPVPSPVQPAALTGEEVWVTAPMPGNVLDVLVSVGEQVTAGDNLLMLEAMKMENEIVAPCNGIVKKIAVSKSAAVETNTLLVILCQEGGKNGSR